MTRSASEFVFRETADATSEYGPAFAVSPRNCTWITYGYIRRILNPQERGCNFAIYRADWSEAGTSDLRSTAANWLKHDMNRAAVTTCDGCGQKQYLRDLRANSKFSEMLCTGCFATQESA